MKTNSEVEPVEVFAGTIMQAEMVKSLLNNAEIEAFLKDEILGTLVPWYTSPGASGAVKVIISSADFDRAISIVEEYEKSLR